MPMQAVLKCNYLRDVCCANAQDGRLEHTAGIFSKEETNGENYRKGSPECRRNA